MITAATRQLVFERAAECCEYCKLPQNAAPYFRFHVEHILARQHGGGDELFNLCLACPDCNSAKGPNLASIDPETGEISLLYNPREDRWQHHFTWSETKIIGLTPQGRTTVRLLKLNNPERIRVREELQGRYSQ